MNSKFAYTDDSDRCYGITGMVISLGVFDCQDKILEISIDGERPSPISFTPDFLFSSNPRFSAKTAWNEALREYQLLTGMVVGNIMCRRCVKARGRLTRELVDEMRELVADEGREACGLDDDEIGMVFDKTCSYISNVLNADSRVRGLIDTFAGELSRRRTMTGEEVTAVLGQLHF